MDNNVTNLLPPERRQSLARDFLLRLVVVCAVLVTVLALIAAVLLVPTYVFLEKSVRAKQAHLTSMDSVLPSSDETAISARLATLSSNAAKLAALADAPSASAVIRAALAIQRAGITISSFSYKPATGKALATLIISGSSTTRDALRDYQLMLQSAPFARSATLPVSSYAKDTNIPFVITITLAS